MQIGYTWHARGDVICSHGKRNVWIDIAMHYMYTLHDKLVGKVPSVQYQDPEHSNFSMVTHSQYEG